ncbi:MAG: formylmethanofuran dehydrogenase subunit E family protein [Deltaproteobacteria bacterium]|nr:formylmethanofuran dehydrogenase subunit E family protein [Deltaproteobacteria bacterium]
MIAPTTTPSDPSFWQALLRLHGHRCPMSILGARLGLAALDVLGPERAGRRLSARYLHQTCALDGIQLATSCTLGNGNLQVEAKGEHRLLLWDPETREQARVRLTAEALEVGRRYAELRGRRDALAPGSQERAAGEARMEELLRELEEAPTPSLVATESVEA